MYRPKSFSMAAKPHPPLMKKHSQTDLVSRLKTRKILGVGGEDDDGEVHRSKISQMLGNEIKFAMREPVGLRIWILFSAVVFTLMALMALAFPNQLFEVVFDQEQTATSTSIRLYGGAVLITCVTLVELGLLSNAAILLLLSRILFLIITLSYYYHLGRRPKKI
ncbi:tumor protein p53-inducible protein 11b isoform X3 [Brachyhypopomus gauderio]|uniref:tumor protein p53-inducible protein 11b isoform X3 n=1 Tax=Brachyhypopomus gauderio TaxID=698409 RepID=UPI0040416C5B